MRGRAGRTTRHVGRKSRRAQDSRSVGRDVTALRWIIDAYNLTYAAAILSAGTLGDLFGRRRLFCLGMLVFIGGSIGCALAPTIAWLIAARAVTGVGAALEVPATLALLSVAFPERAQAARARALGIWASMNGFAFIIGPLLGGVLADTFGWRSLFAVAIPVALAAVVLALGLPESEIASGHALDIGGQLLAASMLGGFAAAGMAAGTHDMQAGLFWLVVGGAAAAAFVARERRAISPLIDLTLFRDGPFFAATLATMAMTFGMYGVLFLVPLILQTFQHRSAIEAGIALLPMSAVFVIVSTFSGSVVAAIGRRLTATAGMAAMAGGCLTLGFAGTGPPALSCGLALAGLGLGLATGTLLGYAVARAPDERSGMAAGIGNAARMLGATLGVAVIGGSISVAGSGHTQWVALGFICGGLVQALGTVAAFAGMRGGDRAPRSYSSRRLA
ncbi:MAG TPA: MFS transporter [Candidatus Lustribacter sp.]